MKDLQRYLADRTTYITIKGKELTELSDKSNDLSVLRDIGDRKSELIGAALEIEHLYQWILNN